MNWNNNMRDVKDVTAMRVERASGRSPSGLYGDSVGGMSFSEHDSAQLREASAKARGEAGGYWYSHWAGPAMTCWTLIDCRPLTQRERAEYAAEVAEMEAC